MMFDEITEAFAWGLYWVCLAAWRTLPIFAIVWILHLAVRHRISARYSCLLWMLVVARLLLPVSAPSPVGVSAKADAAIARLAGWNEASNSSDREFETYTFQNENGE